MRGALQSTPKLFNRLNPVEWFIVLAMPLIVIIAIRFLAAFYIGMTLLGLITAYLVLVAWDYNRYAKIKKQNKRKKVVRKFHFVQTLRYGLLALVLAFIYLSV